MQRILITNTGACRMLTNAMNRNVTMSVALDNVCILMKIVAKSSILNEADDEMLSMMDTLLSGIIKPNYVHCIELAVINERDRRREIMI